MLFISRVFYICHHRLIFGKFPTGFMGYMLVQFVKATSLPLDRIQRKWYKNRKNVTNNKVRGT